MWKRMILMLLVVFLCIAGIAFWKVSMVKAAIAAHSKFAMPPSAVTTVVVKGQTWQPVLSAVGSLKAVNGVTVSTDLAGIVSEISFESGAAVKKGDLLIKLDTQQEEAQLHAAEAKLQLAKLDLERKRDLIAKKTISPSDWDSAQSEFNQMEASVDEAKAVIARKRITAPFDGYLGIRQVNLGQYLNPGASIVPLQSLDPIYVEFNLPQQNLANLAVGKKLRIRAADIATDGFDAEINAIDSKVDDSTRNVMVQGTARNPDHKLRPGMFVNVEVLLPETEGVLAIPVSSINYAPYGDSVYVVKPASDGKPGQEVEQTVVKLGPKRGDQVSVLSGLKDGDEVVTSGVFKLRPHAAVQVNNAVQPDNSLTPKPKDT
ncbi:MAG: efflux RND transporter periplasmic adaptor subunit [Chthoniobacter sp.]|nr:efflux RND transporter periplasmic adaptor subunit [Chthoniobacter sp.]